MLKLSHSQLFKYPIGHLKIFIDYNPLILLLKYFGIFYAFYKSNTVHRRIGMRWMETIKVQSATGKERTAEQALRALADDIYSNPDRQGLREAAVSSHATVPGYFALRLSWDTENPQPGGSLLGMSLAQILKAFGLVDHSVWIEAHNRKGGDDNVQQKQSIQG